MNYDPDREPLDTRLTLFGKTPSVTLSEGHEQIRALLERMAFCDAMEAAPAAVAFLIALTVEPEEQARAVDHLATALKAHLADFERYRHDPDNNPLHDVEGSA